MLPSDVQASLNRQVSRLLKQETQKQIEAKFKEIKSLMIQEFLTHPVTEELKLGPDGTNISGTLGGVSNLFAFIGFEKDYNPIKPILEILESMQINYIGDIPKGNRFNINFPTSQEIFSITPMPWATGRSWAQGIEEGMSGLGYLLTKNNQSSSRSGAAIQTSVKVRSGGFQNTPYISALLKKYTKEFNNLTKK